MFKENGIFIDILGKFGEAGKEYDLSSLDSKFYEDIGYCLVNKEEYEEDLISWMTERKENEEDYCLIKEDLKTLLKYDDEFIFLSINDNEFLIKSQCDEAEAYWKKQGCGSNYHAFNEVLGKFISALQKEGEHYEK